MDLSTQERSIKVIPFDGKDKDWREWSSNFLARANLYGYKDVLLGNMKVPPEEKGVPGIQEAQVSTRVKF